MKETHPPMTGVEEKFEEELGNVPKQKKRPAESQKKPTRQTKETKADRKIEELMQLGR